MDHSVIKRKRQTIHSREGGDYFRLLLKGEYKITVTVGDKILSTSIKVEGIPATVVNFVVGEDSITAQSVHPDNGNEVASAVKVDIQLVPGKAVGEDSITAQSVYPDKVNEVASAVKEDIQFLQGKKAINPDDDVKKEAASQTQKVVKSSRSDNVAAAAVIVTIGVIVCVLAGVVLFRKVKDLRGSSATESGYAKINEDKFDPSYEP